MTWNWEYWNLEIQKRFLMLLKMQYIVYQVRKKSFRLPIQFWHFYRYQNFVFLTTMICQEICQELTNLRIVGVKSRYSNTTQRGVLRCSPLLENSRNVIGIFGGNSRSILGIFSELSLYPSLAADRVRMRKRIGALHNEADRTGRQKMEPTHCSKYGQQAYGKCMKMYENGWKWMKMDENGWKWMKKCEVCVWI